MEQEIVNYLETQRVGVLAVEMPDGSPHAATVHFAHSNEPLLFYFETRRDSRKAQALLGRNVTRATFVIGSDESSMKTFQLDGLIEVLKDDEKGTFDSVYLAKFPEKKEKSYDPQFIFFKFMPTWWRFTDWKAPHGKKILTSE